MPKLIVALSQLSNMKIVVFFHAANNQTDSIRIEMLSKGYYDHFTNKTQAAPATVVMPVGVMVSESISSLKQALQDIDDAATVVGALLLQSVAFDYNTAAGSGKVI
jgi:hypothetical protein